MMEIINDNESFNQLKQEWNKLLHNCNSDNLFLTWGWTFNYWKYFQNKRELMILLIKEDDNLIGIVPLCRNIVRKYGLKLNQIEFIASNSPLDYLDIIIKNGKEEKVIKEIIGYLDKLEWDCVFFDNVLTSSPNLILLQKYFKNYYLFEKGICTYAKLPKSFDDYLSSLGTSTKKSAKRYERKISNDFKIEFDYANKANFEEYMGIFLKFHSEQFKNKKDGFTKQMINFVKAVSKEALDKGYLRLYSLKLDGKHVSLLHCFNYNNRIYHYNGGYNEDYSKYSVGFVRFLYAIESSIKEGIKEFDFLMGGEEYKKRLGNKNISVSSLTIFKGSFKGKILKFMGCLKQNIYK